MRLFELFTTKHNLRKTTNVSGLDDDDFFFDAEVYKTKIDGTLFVFWFRGEGSGDDYEFGFGELLPKVDKDDYPRISYKLNSSNAKASFKVYSIAVDLIRRFVIKTNPLDKLFISGADSKQTKLYLSMMKRLQAQLPKDCGIFYCPKGLFITKEVESYLSMPHARYKYLPPPGFKK